MFIEWHPSMAIGIESIDEEHKKLVELLNGLHEYIDKNIDKETLSKSLIAAMSYCVFHFNHEEMLFLPTDYPEKEEHVKEHKRIAGKLAVIRERMGDEPAETLALDLLFILKEWFIAHIQHTDVPYVPYVKRSE